MRIAPIRAISAIFMATLFLSHPVASPAQTPQDSASDHPMTIPELFAWKNARFPVLSNDGHSVAYVTGPFLNDSEIVVHTALDDKDQRFPVGQDGGAAKFSADSQWLAFTARPTHKQTELLKKQQKPAHATLRLLNLQSGVLLNFENFKDFSFSNGPSDWLAVHKEQPEALAKDKSKDKPTGSDLVLRELSTKAELNFGNVSNYAFDKSGKWLAMTIDAQNAEGNGLILRNMETGAVSSIDNAHAVYERLNWTESGDALAVLRGNEDKKFDNRIYAVIGVTGFLSGNPQKMVYDPATDNSFPKNMVVSGHFTPAWTSDLHGLLFGICPTIVKIAPVAPESSAASADNPPVDDDQPNLMIWNWQDTRVQTLQRKQQQKDSEFSYLATNRVEDRKFFRLANENLREVQPSHHSRWAVGLDEQPYALQAALNGQTQEVHAQVFADLYVVDLETQARRLLHKKVRVPWYAGPSPDGNRVLFFEDSNYHVCELATAACKEISSRVPTSFIDILSDHYSVSKPPVLQPAPVWSSDSHAVLVSDAYDLWLIPIDNRPAVNLTVTEKKQQTSYRLLSLESKHDFAAKGVDLSRPLYLSMFGMVNKKGGFARIDPGKTGAQVLRWEDAIFSELAKARDADSFVYKRETHTQAPDYYLADQTLANHKKLSDVSAQQHGIAWSSGSRLIQYTSAKGDKLQAALFLPANYHEGHSYPTIVTIYERKSQELNSYFSPTFLGIFDEMLYTSHGYAVLEPDITYRTNDPGMSAVWCVLPALQAAIATGIVDAKHVGLQGHSWGGYQTAFLVTQTNVFAAAEAGAALTDMVSMWGLVYKNTGNSNSPLLESGQGRFSGPPLDNIGAYIRNSPVFHAAAVKTPLLMVNDDQDGAVDFTQGLEFYSALRRLGKPVVLLEYPGENHVLQKPANQRDYTLRLLVFFDHFLKGAPAPIWWTKGISLAELQNEIRNGTAEKNAAGDDTEASLAIGSPSQK